MKEVLIAAAALLVGALIGGIVQTKDSRTLERSLADCETEAKRMAKRMAISSMLRSSREPSPTVTTTEQGSVHRTPQPTPERQAELGDASRQQFDQGSEETPAAAPTSNGELDAARMALDLRRTQARAALLEQADLDQVQIDDFDSAVTDLNADLNTLADDLIAMLQDGKDPSRYELMIMASNTLDVLIMAEDRFADTLGADYFEVDDTIVDPLSWIDPTIIDRFEAAEGF